MGGLVASRNGLDYVRASLEANDASVYAFSVNHGTNFLTLDLKILRAVSHSIYRVQPQASCPKQNSRVSPNAASALKITIDATLLQDFWIHDEVRRLRPGP